MYGEDYSTMQFWNFLKNHMSNDMNCNGLVANRDTGSVVRLRRSNIEKSAPESSGVKPVKYGCCNCGMS